MVSEYAIIKILLIDCVRTQDIIKGVEMKRIAIDAMGGDNAPKAIVEGVNQAIEAFSDIEIQLYGDQTKINSYLIQSDRVAIIHTDEKIMSDDEPAKAVRRKRRLQWF